MFLHRGGVRIKSSLFSRAVCPLFDEGLEWLMSLVKFICRERAERRKLKRMLTSERRGAIRELRRDASYLGEQHALEKHSEERDRKRDVRGNTAWLAKLEQDFKSGGQGGMWKKKGKKS